MSTSSRTTRRSQKAAAPVAEEPENLEGTSTGKRRSTRISGKPVSVETPTPSTKSRKQTVFKADDDDSSSDDNMPVFTKKNNLKVLMSPGSELAEKVSTLDIGKRAAKGTNLKKKIVEPKTPEKESKPKASEGSPEKKPRTSDEPTTEALKGRKEEFDSLKSWILNSKEKNKSLSIYISGQPGTGKTATTTRVLKALGSSVRSCIVNCASTSTKSALFKTIFESLDLDGKPNVDTFEEHIKKFKVPLVLVLDEIDHLASRKNTALYAAFQWPETLSSKIIILGIANSIDLTERLLPKLMLTKPPKRLVFEPYTKDDIVEILNDKMRKEEAAVDAKAIELTARKVAAMSGDLRTALHIFKQQKSRLNSDEPPGTPVNGCREVLGIINNVYSSPLARARLPLQPRILLAVSLALSTNKKSTFDRNSLLGAYYKACEALRMPALDDDDLHSAFQTLESQSFIRQINGGKLVLQVDAPTAKSAISDNAMLDQIGLLQL